MKKLLLLFVLSPLCLQAAWNVLDRQDWPSPGGKFVASELKVTNGSADAEVNLVSFNPAEITLEVVENMSGQIRGLRELIEARGGVAGINGGYFEANLDPVGLLISNDRVVHHLQKAKLLSGVFSVKHDRLSLTRTQEFSGTKGIQQAIQSGPFLVDGARTVPGLDNRRIAARTFVFSCGPLLWGFGICRSVTLEEMGNILGQTTIVSGHPIVHALNFDGGSSTTFYARTESQTIFSEGRPTVSNYLILKANK